MEGLSAIVRNSNFCLRLADATADPLYEAREALLKSSKTLTVRRHRRALNDDPKFGAEKTSS